MGDTETVPWTPERALVDIGHYAPDIRRLSAEANRALEPIRHKVLIDRLSVLQLAMTSGWSDAKTRAWLTESHRLLADLPEDILLASIDEAVKVSAKGFMPSVGEIRAIADPRLADRQRIARRLKSVAELQDGRRPEAKQDVPEYCDPAEAARIIDEFKLRRTDDPQEVRVRHDTPPRKPTDEDYAALMGITVEEFLRRREAMRAEIAEAEARNAAEMQAAADEMAKVLAA